MVSDKLMKQSNIRLQGNLDHPLVAIFVGATGGIGGTTLRKFITHTVNAKIFIVARSRSKFDALVVECESINPSAQLEFVEAGDLSTVAAVNQVCAAIQAKNTPINLLFMAFGGLDYMRDNSEGNRHHWSETYLSRYIFTEKLLPQIRAASVLRRVVTVYGGTLEGVVDTTDLQAKGVWPTKIRGHIASSMTLSMEIFAKDNPTVSFVHYYPKCVKTKLCDSCPGVAGSITRRIVSIYWAIGWYENIDKVGERLVFVSTSAAYPPNVSNDAAGVPLSKSLSVMEGSTGSEGSGCYSVSNHGECKKSKPKKIMAELRRREVGELFLAETKKLLSKMENENPVPKHRPCF